MRYLMTFSYDGSEYHGFQKQKGELTIQDEIEKKLKVIHNSPVHIHASGRTDAHVHALNQKAHFDFYKEITPEKLRKALNKMLRKDIYIKEIKEVANDFHARFNVKRKKYIYKLNVGEYNPLDRKYVYQYNHNLNVEKMKKGISYLVGYHNFKGFTKADKIKKDYNRTIINASIEEKDNIIIFTFLGTGFLRYMVRNMVGTLIAIGEGKIEPDYIKEIINKQDRKMAFKTINPEGLYLEDVYYE